MSKRAKDGINNLIFRTQGLGGKVKAEIVVDQVYAQVQHEAMEFRHPRGGMAKYMTVPLTRENRNWIQAFADDLLEGDDFLHDKWADHVGEGMRGAVAEDAPLLFNDLRRSAALTVTDGGTVALSRPAEVQRLSEEDLKRKSAWRDIMGLMGM